MKTSEILLLANKLVSGERHIQNGDKAINHKNIASLWSAYMGYEITPQNVAIMMALLKIARTKLGNNNLDNFVDGCGYIAIAGELSKK